MKLCITILCLITVSLCKGQRIFKIPNIVATQNDSTHKKLWVKPTITIVTPSVVLIPSNYYTANFGIMCKQELKLEKLTKIPFRFRLGSLDYCNKLEGKR